VVQVRHDEAVDQPTVGRCSTPRVTNTLQIFVDSESNDGDLVAVMVLSDGHHTTTLISSASVQ